MSNITKLIETNEIRIVSGEGEVGTTEIYNGKRSLRAIKIRLTKERCGGDRWAYAKVFSNADVFFNFETGEYC
jgi:hypothetical protein